MTEELMSHIGVIMVVKNRDGRRKAFIDVNTGEVLNDGELPIEYLQSEYNKQMNKLRLSDTEIKRKLVTNVEFERKFTLIFGVIGLMSGVILFSIFPPSSENPTMSGVAIGALITGLMFLAIVVFQGLKIKKYKKL